MPEVPAKAGPPAEDVATLTEMMRSGRTAAAERQIGRMARKLGGGEDGQEAVLAAVVGEAQVHQSLMQLENWLDGTVDLKAAAPVAAWWALPASGIDLEPRVHEVRLFIDNYPSEGRKIPILQASAADWLVRRLALFFDPATRLPAIRAAIAMLVRATGTSFPDTSRAFRAVLDDYDDEALWYCVAEMLVRSQLVVEN